MDPVVASVLVTLSGFGMRIIAAIYHCLALRWRVREEHAHRQTLVALAQTLPAGSRLDEVRRDGSRVSLVIPRRPQQPERGAR